ncbi:sulfurtransferase TusA family protein [Paenibacillus alginolyticus]|uniref:Sulfurtransferase TusA family protein n=1 Tax=Paenibacillus alginolyticus TaxID=59839 RepID=A0ABT4GMX2_9BACL|nr:sulfurtransferase TusA family protein [Paenibacillus alginolyticus]MCY9697576.1 sulfurtransferase TusA family protein [Paenibacillus alginolyticus]MEC0143356.1 sulfurtransferase TusA family protein [Paenibacillus alginolyticus]
MNIKKVVDAKGLACPMPIVRTKKAMDELLSGDILEVRTTDKGSKADLTAWTKSTGNQLIEAKEENGVFIFLIQKG